MGIDAIGRGRDDFEWEPRVDELPPSLADTVSPLAGRIRQIPSSLSIFGTIFKIFRYLFYPFVEPFIMVIWNVKEKVIDRLVEETKISQKEGVMLKEFERLELEGGDQEAVSKRFTPEELERLPELLKLLAKEFRYEISRGVYLEDKDKTLQEATGSRLSTVHYMPGWPELKNGGIGFINGVNTDFQSAKDHAIQVSECAQANIQLIYNATHSLILDVVECIVGKLGVPTYPESLLRLQWEEFFATHGPEAKFLQVCHSQGSIHVRSALRSSPEWMRQRIIVLSVAPAAILLPDDCLKSHQLASYRDIIPFLNPSRERSYLTVLPSHPQASLWDHAFESPTYKDEIEKTVRDFLSAQE